MGVEALSTFLETNKLLKGAPSAEVSVQADASAAPMSPIAVLPHVTSTPQLLSSISVESGFDVDSTLAAMRTLEDKGLVVRTVQDGRDVFALTDDGRQLVSP